MKTLPETISGAATRPTGRPMGRKQAMAGLSLLCLAFVFIIGGCNPFFWRKTSFRSDLKMKVAVLPFEDSARVAGPAGGLEVAQKVAGDLEKTGRFVIVPVNQVEAYMRSRRIPAPLTPNMVTVVGRALGLNAVVLGSISEVSQLQKQTGWLKFFRFHIPYLSESSDVLTYVLVAKVVDVETGVILGADVGSGEVKTGQSEEELMMGNPDSGLDPKIKAASMNEASEALTDSIIKAFKRINWKGFIIKIAGGTATLSAGHDVGIESGDLFQVFSTAEKITNQAGQTYLLPGPPKAELRALSVTANTTDLQVIKGQVEIGDTAQAIK